MKTIFKKLIKGIEYKLTMLTILISVLYISFAFEMNNAAKINNAEPVAKNITLTSVKKKTDF